MQRTEMFIMIYVKKRLIQEWIELTEFIMIKNPGFLPLEEIISKEESGSLGPLES